MNELIGKKVLITFDDYFYAPDGKQYRSAWGTLQSVTEAAKVFGFKPQQSANWFLEIGDLIIAGCRVHYCCYLPPKAIHGKNRRANNRFGSSPASKKRLQHLHLQINNSQINPKHANVQLSTH